MDRLACVSISSLSLQIALKRNPAWLEEPVAVVDELKPLGFILEVNRIARQSRVLPGMRYSAALSLTQRLRAAVVDVQDIVEHVKLLQTILLDFTPNFEPKEDEPGVFWLKASGLDRLFGSFETWCEQLYQEVRSYGFYCSIVVGFTRFATYALSRSHKAGFAILTSVEEETHHMGRVYIASLAVSPKTRDVLAKLGVETLKQFLALPVSGVRERFGEEAYRLRRMSEGQLAVPLQPVAPEDPVGCQVDLDTAECDSTRLLFLIKERLHLLLLELTARHCDLKELVLRLVLEDRDVHEHVIQPATPTLVEKTILDLARLKLENLTFPSGVVTIELVARGVAIRRNQEALFAGSRRRDMEAANHALAQIRAEFGDNSVSEITEANGHLPERSFELRPLGALARPLPVDVPPQKPMIRRLRRRPQPLHRFRWQPLEGWLITGLDAGPVTESWGPFSISGFWWSGNIAREYFFARTRRGDLYWVYFDQVREQWFLHGVLE